MTTSTATLLDAALRYAAQGWAVFPLHSIRDGVCTCGRKNCSSPGKHPLTSSGFKEATSDLKKVREFWTSYPGANIGVATGTSSGITVLDVDDPKQFVAMTEEHGQLPATRMAKTGGGGVHLLYRYEPGIRNKAGIFPKIDVRGDGGYIVAPPSVHQSGERYQWVNDDASLSLWPETLTKLANKSRARQPVQAPTFTGKNSPYGQKALDGEIARLRSAQNGTRNHTLNETAFCLYQLVAGGELDEGVVTSELAFNARGLGLDEREIEATLRSAREGGFSNPRSAPEPTDVIDRTDRTKTKAASVNTVNTVRGVVRVPLRPHDRAPAFPTECLPDWLRQYVEGLAESSQVPRDLPASFALSAVAMLIARKVTIQLEGEWTEPTNLYKAVALPPGERKSAVVRAISRPIVDLEEEFVNEALPEITTARTERDIAERRHQQAITEAGKAQGTDRLEKEQEAQEAAQHLESLQVPSRPCLLVDDVTPEALATMLSEQEGRLAVMSAEGTLFEIAKGRYSNDPNFDVLLRAHVGDEHRVNRKGRPAEIISEPALTIAVAIQPQVLEGLAIKQELEGKGLLARFAWVMPEPMAGYRNLSPAPLSPGVREVYETKIKALGRAFYKADRVTVQLSTEANAVLRTWREEIEHELRPAGRLSHIKGWGSKLAGLTVRVAGVLHFAEYGQPGIALNITERTMSDAITIGRFFFAHAEKVFDFMGADPGIGKAQHILRWIEGKGITEFTQRELHRALGGTLRKASDIEPALALLVSYGWIEEVPVEHSGVGRKPSPLYRVIPSTEPTVATEQSLS